MRSGCHSALFAISFAIFAFAAATAAAQSYDDEYRHIYQTDDYLPRIEADTSVFYRAVRETEDIFANVADYDLSFVAFSRRGERSYARKTVFDGIPVRSEYRYALDYLQVDSRRYSGMRHSDAYIGGINGFTEYRSDFAEPLSAHSVNINFADRGYWVGGRATICETFDRGWSLSAYLAGRTGRDMHIKGVFTNAVESGVKLQKHWNYDHRLTITAMFSPSERGTRRASTAEAYRLTGDNLYNPSWGYQNGKVRNANVRRTAVPSLIVAYDGAVSQNTTLTIAAGADVGTGKYSALEWFDALTPMPDNYRFLPSYYEDEDVAAGVADVWRKGDPRYTQIDWDELCRQNRLAGGNAVYAVGDRVERIVSANVRASAVTMVGSRTTIGYGLYMSYNNSRNYRQMRDLLGSDHIVDIDQYLVDDAAYGNMLQNDLRNPDRMIREGDRFGYDYSLTDRYLCGFVTLNYNSDRINMDFAADIGERMICRNGFYEKELFAGNESFGRSRRMHFAPYTVKAAFGYSFTPRHYLEVSAAFVGETPDARDLFLQTQYNNRTIDNPVLRSVAGGELNYTFLHKVVNLRASLFANISRNDCEVSHYYDDLAAEYCDMVVSGIDRLNIGAEIAATFNISRRLSASVAVTAGRYTYFSDPCVTLYSDIDNRMICDNAVSHMGACKVGNAPQIAATADVAYMNKGWGVRLSVNCAALRYVEPAAMRRTDRVSRQGSVSEEIFRTFVDQERLADAVTADGSVWKVFWLKRDYSSRSRIVVSLSVRNLLGSSNIVYNARESVRVKRKRVAGSYLYEPFPTTYLYSMPRTLRLSLTYRF